MTAVVDLAASFSGISEFWHPKVAAEINDHELKLVKVDGVFPWHRHEDVDELFLVWSGDFRIEFRDQVLHLGPGQLATAPRGIEHRTASDHGAEVLIVERRDVVNTGDAPPSEFTAPVGAKL